MRGAGGHGGGVELRGDGAAGAADREGEQLGMFHFGGSTHCLLFRPGVELAFDFYGQQPGLEATNLRINTALARVT